MYDASFRPGMLCFDFEWPFREVLWVEIWDLVENTIGNISIEMISWRYTTESNIHIWFKSEFRPYSAKITSLQHHRILESDSHLNVGSTAFLVWIFVDFILILPHYVYFHINFWSKIWKYAYRAFEFHYPHAQALAHLAQRCRRRRRTLWQLREQAVFCFSDMAILLHRHILREGPSRGQTIAFYATTRQDIANPRPDLFDELCLRFPTSYVGPKSINIWPNETPKTAWFSSNLGEKCQKCDLDMIS